MLNTVQSPVDRLFFRKKYDAGLQLQNLRRASASVLDPDSLARMFLDGATATIPVESAAVLLRHTRSDDFHVIAQRGLARHADIRLPGRHPLVGWLSRNGTVLAKRDIDLNPRSAKLWSAQYEQLEKLQVELFVPLMSGEELIGISVLGPKRSGGPYAASEKRILETLATQTAVAIQSAQLHQEIVEAKETAETIVREAFTGILVTDTSLRVVALNPQAQIITGYAPYEVLGRNLPDVFGTELWGGETSLLYQAVTTGERVAPTESQISGKHSKRDILVGVTPFREGYLLSFIDISHLKEVDQLKSNIVANVSHELRAPLASIKAYTELLLDNLDEEDGLLRSRFLTVIDQETDRLTGLINDLLDLARLESGEVDLRWNAVSVNDVVKDIAGILEVQARARDIAVCLDLPADLPAIVADGQLITTLVKNLISNAIKFSHEGGQVDVATRKHGECIVLDVADRGRGIPAEELPHIFEKFYRSRMVRDEGIGGSGLGLALVREAVETHNGTIDVDSELGAGTRFTVAIPIDRHAAGN